LEGGGGGEKKTGKRGREGGIKKNRNIRTKEVTLK